MEHILWMIRNTFPTTQISNDLWIWLSYSNLSDDKWSKGNRSNKKTANNNRSNITKNMKKKVDLYYCFPMANSWEIYFNSAFYSADVILGLELWSNGQIEELFDQIGYCIWMIKLDIVFEWSNWTMYFSILVAILAPNFITHARSVVGDKSSMCMKDAL